MPTTRKKQIISDTSNETSVMLLGVYHFNNPGQDTYNTKIDDYYSDRRQEEIKEVVGLLREYNPTKIFVELTPKSQSKIDSLYQLHLNDRINLHEIKGGVNEVYQIGFRLGKQSGGIPITAVDHAGPWLGDYVDFIADTLALDYYQEKKSEELKFNKEKQKRLVSNTVKENLIYINEDRQIIGNHDYYNNIAIRVKDSANIMFSYQESEQEIEGLPYLMRSYDFNNIGVELVAEWYKRNLFIYRNIIENSQQNDRIVVIIGSGHVFYLNQLLANNPKFDLTNPNELLINAKNED
ncbi:DUF5694 domain-containing protein [Marivirga tractuosa]|uniref:Uncharacterized protein n=1 Tax=Marivirga tractuosa (strain ATCC 23168 / DSM 4126 / NBRC 15989 / NCIMB 1408 / VKM B-1430 / H-43) TaxID=643867 RepID=E4TRH4_MARTH|nr:DUF5694 domain-containing protein [Marivirga tractuosa]ADR20708.1 hypothetical protein Ftrac_0706 [Marivirga tractuosa DSM 4126]